MWLRSTGRRVKSPLPLHSGLRLRVRFSELVLPPGAAPGVSRLSGERSAAELRKGWHQRRSAAARSMWPRRHRRREMMGRGWNIVRTICSVLFLDAILDCKVTRSGNSDRGRTMFEHRGIARALAAAGVLACSISAFAADMPVKAPPPAVSLWTGFYVGGNGGYSWGKANTDVGVPAFIVAGVTIPGSSLFGLEQSERCHWRRSVRLQRANRLAGPRPRSGFPGFRREGRRRDPNRPVRRDRFRGALHHASNGHCHHSIRRKDILVRHGSLACRARDQRHTSLRYRRACLWSSPSERKQHGQWVHRPTAFLPSSVSLPHPLPL